MAKLETKIQSIEEQIKKLQQKKKRELQKQRTNVGKHLLEKWEIQDESIAYELIEYLVPNVEEYLREKYGRDMQDKNNISYSNESDQ